MKLNIIKTPAVTIFVFSSKKKEQYNHTFTFNNSHINFEDSKDLADQFIKLVQTGEEKITKHHFAVVEELHDVVATLSNWTNGLLAVDSRGVTYNGQPINEHLQEYLLELFTTKGAEGISELESWSNFIAAINRADSYKVLNRLFMFLRKQDLTIDADGFVLAWKVVRPNFTDKYTGRFDNSVGKTVEVDRNKVNDDDTVTCSHGLHICSWGYLSSFSHTGDPVVQVRVDPKDIVAIPLDYKGDKVRVCKYEVIKHVGNWNQGIGADKLPVTDGIRATITP